MRRFFTLLLGLIGVTSWLSPPVWAGGPTFTEDVRITNATPDIRLTDNDADEADWEICVDNGCPGTSDVNQGFHIARTDDGVSTIPFIIENNTATGLLYLDKSKRVGIGTTTPAQELHIRSTFPQIRLDDTSFGAGRVDFRMDTHKFAIEGSVSQEIVELDTRAPSPSLTIVESGRVGLGTQTPGGNLHIFGEAGQDVFSGIGPDPITGPALNFGYSGNSFGRGSGFFNVRPDAAATPPNPSLRFATNNTQRMIITNIGRVGIGTSNPSQRLDVSGNIRASGNFISGATALNVPDYVFEADYRLPPLPEVAAYVQQEKRLPGLPSAEEIKEQGLNLTEVQIALLKKVEELTLYTIAQQEQLVHQAEQLGALQRENATLRQQVAAKEGALEQRLAVLEQQLQIAPP